MLLLRWWIWIKWKWEEKSQEKKGGGSGRDALEVEEMIKERERRMEGLAAPVDLKVYLGIWIMVVQLCQYIRQDGQDGPWRGEGK